MTKNGVSEYSTKHPQKYTKTKLNNTKCNNGANYLKETFVCLSKSTTTWQGGYSGYGVGWEDKAGGMGKYGGTGQAHNGDRADMEQVPQPL